MIDSLTYEWTAPLQSENSSVTYSGSYSYDKPLSFWRFPNSNLHFPEGFHLDELGNIQFQPMQAEITNMAVLEKQFIKGILVGMVRRDMQIIVINCPPNHPPTLTTPNNITYKEATVGSMVTFNFTTNDQDSTDTVTISWNKAIPGAQWTSTNGLFKHPTGTLSWTPGVQYASSVPYSFTVTVKDNACPIRGIFSQTYQILVIPFPKAYVIISDSGGGLYYMTAIPIIATAPSYLWMGGSASDNFILPGRTVHHKFKSPGIYPISLCMTDRGNSTTYFDTIFYDTSLLNINPGINNPMRNELIVYPNPSASSENLIIETDNNIFNQVALYNDIGQKLKEMTIIPGERNILNIKDLKSGIYFLRAQQTKTGLFISKKIIITNN